MKNIFLYLKFGFYFLLTVKERREYSHAKMRGFNCVNSYKTNFETVYVMDKSTPPKRNYLTFQEFKKVNLKK